MLNVFLPLALLFLGLRVSPDAPPTQPQPKPKPKAKPKPKPAAAAKPAAPKPAAPAVVYKPSVPKNETEASEQAAVNAAVSKAVRDEVNQMVRDLTRPNQTPASPDAVVSPVPTAPAAEVVRSPKQAAQDLRAFLLKTGRFGTMSDRPAEVRIAQRDLGVTADGLVGPRTRAAAAAQGVTLPPLNPTKQKN